MAIDWDKDLEPDFVPPQNMVELRTMEDAMKLIDQWREAEALAYREFVRVHSELIDALFWADYYKALAENEETLRLHPVVDLLPA